MNSPFAYRGLLRRLLGGKPRSEALPPVGVIPMRVIRLGAVLSEGARR